MAGWLHWPKIEATLPALDFGVSWQRSEETRAESGASQYWMSHDGFSCKIRGETPVFGRSSNGGFWPRKVENALSFNGI
jgi:hypothetical protein